MKGNSVIWGLYTHRHTHLHTHLSAQDFSALPLECTNPPPTPPPLQILSLLCALRISSGVGMEVFPFSLLFFLFLKKHILLFSTFWKRPFSVSFALNLIGSPALSHFFFLWAPWFFSFIIYLFIYCHFRSPPPSPFWSSILSPFSMIPTHITPTAPLSMLMKHRLLCRANWLTNHKRTNLGMGGQDRGASFIKIILWFVFDSA